MRTEYLHERLLGKEPRMREERSVCHAVEKLDRHETQAGVVFTAHLECSSCGERLVSDGRDWSGALVPSRYCHRCGCKVSEAGTGVGGIARTFSAAVAGSSTSTSGFGDSDISPDQ